MSPSASDPELPGSYSPRRGTFRVGRERARSAVDRVRRRIDESFPRESGKPLRRRLRILVETLAYIYGREGTILVSSITFGFFASVFPILFLVLTLSDYLGWLELRETIFQALRHFFPIAQDFIVRNLRIYTVEVLGKTQVVSLVLIALAGSAFFFAVEAGLDSAYRVPKYRPFVYSQLLGTILTVLWVLTGILGILVWGVFNRLFTQITPVLRIIQPITDLIVSFSLALTLFFCIFYFLPNRPRDVRRAFREALAASSLWILGHFVFSWLATTWALQHIYGPFYVSMTILLWAYTSGCILLATARLSRDGWFGGKPEDRPGSSPASGGAVPQETRSASASSKR